MFQDMAQLSPVKPKPKIEDVNKHEVKILDPNKCFTLSMGTVKTPHPPPKVSLKNLNYINLIDVDADRNLMLLLSNNENLKSGAAVYNQEVHTLW